MEWSLTQNKLLAFHRLMRTDKPIGALLLLWPTLWALWVATPGVPQLWILAVFVAGVWLMRAAGKWSVRRALNMTIKLSVSIIIHHTSSSAHQPDTRDKYRQDPELRNARCRHPQRP